MPGDSEAGTPPPPALTAALPPLPAPWLVGGSVKGQFPRVGQKNSQTHQEYPPPSFFLSSIATGTTREVNSQR
eukprot:756856-Hanusia_phi.AAC.3